MAFNIATFSIPGMMPTTHPVFDAIKYTDYRGAVNLTFSTTAEEPTDLSFRVLDRTGRCLLRDDGGVFYVRDGESNKFVFGNNSVGYFPVGTSFLWVLEDGVVTNYTIQNKDNAFNQGFGTSTSHPDLPNISTVPVIAGKSQQGSISLTEGVDEYDIDFGGVFVAGPELVFTQIQKEGVGNPLFLVAAITDKTDSGFSVVLSAPPDESGYVLTWLASDPSGFIFSVNDYPDPPVEPPVVVTTQTGTYTLLTNQTEYTITFEEAFTSAPVVFTQARNSEPGDTVHLLIDSVVTEVTTTYFKVILSQLPDTTFYRLDWTASIPT